VPGYTHLQRAQPVSLTHYWLAYVEKFARDRGRLADCRRRLNESPLGAAALAGTTLPIDRHATAAELGFDRPAGNSLDVASDRDFVVEYVAALSLIAIHLSTWAEEWILWCSTEFGFLKLPDAYTTGSSIMPQKRNPDVLELTRGKSARVTGALSQLLFLIKGLPLAYNRDLQEDKLALFAAHDAAAACLELAPEVVRGARVQHEAIARRLDDGFLDATALMEYLIRRGVPMRTGHETVGKLVRLCESRGCRLKELTLDDFREACDRIDAAVYETLGAESAARALASYGAGSPSAVAERLAEWKVRLGLGTAPPRTA
jgi:argininosuccinate lyase